MNQTLRSNRTVYCHFSFRRPRNEEFGYFAVAFYNDFEGTKMCAQATRKIDLWEDQQFIAAVQSYEHALYSIYEWQGIMKSKGINQVMLVTDNSTLAKWIENPTKKKKYAPYMMKANAPYRSGGPKEIVIGVGLCEPRQREKSYQYCKESKVINTYKPKSKVATAGKRKLIIDSEMKSAIDIVTAEAALIEPKIEGTKLVDGMSGEEYLKEKAAAIIGDNSILELEE